MQAQTLPRKWKRRPRGRAHSRRQERGSLALALVGERDHVHLEESVPRGLPAAHSPELVLEGADLTVHGVGRLRGILQLTLQLPTGGVGSLGLLLGLFQLALELLQAGGCLVSLWGCVTQGPG